MLQLKNITKVYKTGDLTQKALDGVSLEFGEQEFASILGPSGSGKTTLLNIIGGLDHYTSGDLIIDGVSTKRFKESDWDSYRNHRIGFVFQSYNLISHQTILNNVRLALTLSGISKREGTRRAKEALKSVGLGDQIHKRPAQLSGGQMQRVAIARALVNDPDILLADEPTGALDSETSVQIMELLKTISKTKLVIMVTHNPDLAEKYSTRIINLKDGKIERDSQNKSKKSLKSINSDPASRSRKSKKTKMSFLTALGLSFNNLLTKKGRTILVAFAGSIGIIGIALILSVSTGFQNYVDSIQEETLTSYPLQIMEESFSLDALLTNYDEGYTDDEKDDYSARAKKYDVIEYPVISRTLSTVATNDLKSFKKYLEENADALKDDVKSISYDYSVDPLIYTIDATNKLSKLNPNNVFSTMMGGNSMMSSFSSYASIFSSLADMDEETLDTNYNLHVGRWPSSYDELIVILPYESTMSDLLAYSLGLKDTSELSSLVAKLMSGESVEPPNLKDRVALNYEDFLNLDLRLILPTDLYQYNEKYDVYEDMSEDDEFLSDVYDNKSIKLKVVGVASAKDSALSSANSGVGFSSALVPFIIDSVKDTDVVKRQLENEDIDVFSGNRFDADTNRFDYDFDDLVSVDENKLSSAFNISIDETELNNTVASEMTKIAESISVDTTPAETDLSDTLDSLATGFSEFLPTYLEENEEVFDFSKLDDYLEKYLLTFEPGEKFSALEETYKIPKDNFRSVFPNFLKLKLLENYGVPLDSEALAAATLAEKQFAAMMTEVKLKAEVMEKVAGSVTTVSSAFAKSFNIDPSAITSAFTLNFSEDELMRVMNAMLNSTEKTLKTNLLALGYHDLESPSYISVYFTSFDGKENFKKFIENYNKTVEEEKQINYSDITGVLMDSVKVIVNAVSYVLIAFVSISLVVSSIMIGIITYISVYERTKEIGILRAMGASKHNISSIFNAETFIIGFLSGLFGIGISFLLLIPINAILNFFTSVENLTAVLPLASAFWLVVLSVVLTLIGGLIPARAASKKDPVEALRTE